MIRKGYIEFNEENYTDSDNFYVKRPDLILKQLTGINWDVRKETSEYHHTEKEYAIECWSIDRKTCHFARTEVGFNSLQNSNCVNKGMIVSYRICTPIK